MTTTDKDQENSRTAIKDAFMIVNNQLDRCYRTIRKNEVIDRNKDDQVTFWRKMTEIERINKLHEMDKSSYSTVMMIVSWTVTFVCLGFLVFSF